MTETSTRAKGRGGRPRDPGRDTAIREAVFSVLASDGYVGMTMDSVAAYAGAGKATIYRRWNTREDLIADVLDGLPKPSTPKAALGLIGETGSDLLYLLREFRGVLLGSYGDAAHAVATVPVPGIRAVILRWHASWHRAFLYVWEDAAERGEVEDEHVQALAEATHGAVVQRWLLGGGLLDDAFLTGLAEALTAGVRS